MGMFAFRRMRDQEAAATAAASFCVPKLETKTEAKPEPKPKKQRTVKPKLEKADGGND
jgi:hypothetical protein